MSSLPTDSAFYDSADNYILGWLAVKLIAQKYGQAKAIAFYEYFQNHSDIGLAFHEVLGTSRDQFVKDWLAYLKQLRAT